MALQPVCRLGDNATGICTAHGSARFWFGTTTRATGGFTCDGIQVCVVGDGGTTDCGHTFTITGGSSVTTGVTGAFVARKTDAVLVDQGGSGSMLTGSPVTSSE